MKAIYCDLCGTILHRTQFLYDIVDTRDRYKRYHHKYWNVCDECHNELVQRREEVIEKIKNQIENENGNCQCDHSMIEFD